MLVITGKGTDPEARRSFYEEDERGVLRQAVPHWLAAPDLAHVVVSFSPAPRRLGGEGALYVRLRKARSPLSLKAGGLRGGMHISRVPSANPHRRAKATWRCHAGRTFLPFRGEEKRSLS